MIMQMLPKPLTGLLHILKQLLFPYFTVFCLLFFCKFNLNIWEQIIGKIKWSYHVFVISMISKK